MARRPSHKRKPAKVPQDRRSSNATIKRRGGIGKVPRVPITVEEKFAFAAQADSPTRATAVLDYIDRVEVHERSMARRLTRDERRRERWVHPDDDEETIRELNRLMRKEIRHSPSGDGLIAGPLTVAARYAAPHLAAEVYAQQANTTGPTRALAVLSYIKRMETVAENDEHVLAIERWLVGNFGEVVHSFRWDAYLRWREESRTA